MGEDIYTIDFDALHLPQTIVDLCHLITVTRLGDHTTTVLGFYL